MVTSRLRTSASPQPGVLHVSAGVVLRRQIYFGRSEPLDNVDDDNTLQVQLMLGKAQLIQTQLTASRGVVD